MSAPNTKALIRLAKLLKKKPHTVGKISSLMDCSKEVARKRILLLHKMGCRFDEKRVREADFGPAPIAYQLRDNPAAKKILATT